MLSQGDQLPKFELQNEEGLTFTNEDFSENWMVLFAFPGSGKSCENQLLDFQDNLRQFKKLGVQVVGVAPQSQKRLGSLSAKHELGFPLLSDPKTVFIEALEAWGEKKMMGKTTEGVLRTTFLIDPNGKIAHVWENVKVAGHSDDVYSHCIDMVDAQSDQSGDSDDDGYEFDDSDVDDDDPDSDSEDEDGSDENLDDEDSSQDD